MSTVVISQPMYFPWVGMFEQWRLADDFSFFDNVQFARGFINRVQYKTPDGSAWLTVPLRQHSRDTRICDLECAEESGWRDKHLRTLAMALSGTPHLQDALGLAESVLLRRDLGLCELLIEGMQAVAGYFDLLDGKRLHRSSQLAVTGRKSELIQGLVAHLGGDRYVTGMGALNYLDHEAFEQAGIEVCYMDYRKREYPQKFSTFTPYVTILDLVANCGREGRAVIESGVIHWRQALAARGQV
ncbi:WbqC family protein [Pseudomonas sp. PA15(2017)]|uniref:WbqC family protein n=1 Tax=Pseudomonas sp. PA15(2017) TaxID=1932111 RepID=UPI000AD72BF2|nr:WbqC family protein [Pseudomonas sp. PA15(2017)]